MFFFVFFYFLIHVFGEGENVNGEMRGIFIEGSGEVKAGTEYRRAEARRRRLDLLKLHHLPPFFFLILFKL